jgi:hypothetical protein
VSYCKGCSSLHCPKAIFCLKLLKTYEFQGLRVFKQVQTNSELVQTSFELVQSHCWGQHGVQLEEPKAAALQDHLRRYNCDFYFLAQVANPTKLPILSLLKLV